MTKKESEIIISKPLSPEPQAKMKKKKPFAPSIISPMSLSKVRRIGARLHKRK